MFKIYFWNDHVALISHYLDPFIQSNESSLSMANFCSTITGLVVALVYLLQNNADLYITLPWPWGDGANTATAHPRNMFAFDLDESIQSTAPAAPAPPIMADSVGSVNTTCIGRRSFVKYDPVSQSVHVEPIGVLFIAVYVAVLLIQFICMLIHRIITFSHLLASTDYQMLRRRSVARKRGQRKRPKKLVGSFENGENGGGHCDEALCDCATKIDTVSTADENQAILVDSSAGLAEFAAVEKEMARCESANVIKASSAVIYKSAYSLPAGTGKKRIFDLFYKISFYTS